MLDKTKAFFKSDPVAKRIAIHVGIVFGFLLAVWAASRVFEIRALKGGAVTLIPSRAQKIPARGSSLPRLE